MRPAVFCIDFEHFCHELWVVIEERHSRIEWGAQKGGFFHNTGEGGVSPYHVEPGGDLCWQIGTGYLVAGQATVASMQCDIEKQRASPQSNSSN